MITPTCRPVKRNPPGAVRYLRVPRRGSPPRGREPEESDKGDEGRKRVPHGLGPPIRDGGIVVHNHPPQRPTSQAGKPWQRTKLTTWHASVQPPREAPLAEEADPPPARRIRVRPDDQNR